MSFSYLRHAKLQLKNLAYCIALALWLSFNQVSHWDVCIIVIRTCFAWILLSLSVSVSQGSYGIFFTHRRRNNAMLLDLWLCFWASHQRGLTETHSTFRKVVWTKWSWFFAFKCWPFFRLLTCINIKGNWLLSKREIKFWTQIILTWNV